MGNLLTAGVNDSRQKLVNEVYQRAEQSCTATCENIQSGNVVFLDGTTTGDITFEQNCTADATCMMEQSLQSVADLLLELKQGNTTEASLFGGGLNVGSVNLNLSEQDIENRVKQIMETLCSAEVSNVQNGNMVYARNSRTGNISFKQEGNAKADCVMQNAASALASLQAKNTQTNATAATIGSFGAFIVAAIVFAVVVSLLNKKKPGDQGQGQQQQQNGGRSFDMSQLQGAYKGK
jgi:hypothetical protein